jgi:hypothetical protein
MLMIVPARYSGVSAFRMLVMARVIRSANLGFPVRCERRRNSRVSVPASAIVISFGAVPLQAPVFKLTCGYGIPLSVANAGASLSPRSSARLSSYPLYRGIN